MANAPKKTGRILESKQVVAKPVETETASKGKLGRKPVPENETRNERFVRLAKGRAQQAVYHIENLANLANRSQYEYTAEQVETVFNFLRASIDQSEKAFLKTFKVRAKLDL